MSGSIFLDNHSTTPLDPRVLEEMIPVLRDDYGNPTSRWHRFGWRAESHVEKARAEVARLIGAAHEREIVFTSGATESNNLALQGAAAHRLPDVATRAGDSVGAIVKPGGKRRRKSPEIVLRDPGFPSRPRIITSQIEHPSVLETCAVLESRGFEVVRLAVDPAGRVRPEDVARAIDERPSDTILVSVMLANNEVGTIQPVAEIGAACRARGVWFHVDAAQAVGRIPVDVQVMKIDLLTMSAHKFNGPKGVGALYVRRKDPRVTLVSQIHGGGQERGMRAGTLNVPGIVGLGAAARLAAREMVEECKRVTSLRDRLWAGIAARVPGARMHGHPTERLPGNLNVYLPDVPAEPLMLAMRDVAISAASACGSQANEPSHVLRAMGIPDEEIHCSLRFGLGRFTTDAEIDETLNQLERGVRTVRGHLVGSPGIRVEPTESPLAADSGKWEDKTV